ncbi:phage tail protein [Streptomyces sp. NPDC021100]|uniref:phage tail protein n=1 Tax=Streptomyces sp. NPDC021100 TaxID=3365114 RepID=UPI00379B967C
MTVRARFLAPDGTPLSGALVFRAPATLTFPAADVILGGPVTVQLDAQGGIEVTLPATDAPDMDPSGWAYIVTEQLSGIPVGRSYNIVLPRAQPEVDLADIAPTDPSKPNYVGVPGPKGDAGPTGAPGSRIYSGTAAPGTALGVDGDLYVRYETTTFLGVTSTTVSTWQRSAGAWAQIGGDVRGAAWYLNNTTTPSTNTKPGDLLLRTDTGDLWQRTASGWGSVLGNLKGPKGDTGATGPTGATGAAGVVQSVNGKSAASVTLTAADVGALATTAAGAANGIAQLDATGKVPAAQLPASGGAVASVNGKTGAVVLTATDVGALDQGTADARYVQPAAIPVQSVAGKTGAVTLAAGDVGAEAAGTAVLLTGTQTVAGSKTFSSVPSSSASPTTSNHLARKSYVDGLGGGTWLPSDLGFVGWTFDPALTNSGQNLLAGYVYLCGINLRAATTINSLVFYSCGYAGGTLNASSFAGLYTSAGARVGLTAALNGTFTANEGATVVCPLTAAYSAAAGNYWVAIVTNGQTASPYNGPVLARGANLGTSPAGAAAMPSGFRRHARLTATGQTALPASFTPASALTYDANALWAAVA